MILKESGLSVFIFQDFAFVFCLRNICLTQFNFFVYFFLEFYRLALTFRPVIYLRQILYMTCNKGQVSIYFLMDIQLFSFLH